MMDTSSMDESKDPQMIWNVFVSAFNNIMKAKPAEVEEMLKKFSQLFYTFPQIFSESQSWPNSTDAIRIRRHSFILSMIRRMIHLAAKSRTDVQSFVGVTTDLLQLLQERDTILWSEILGQILNFWTKVQETSVHFEEDVTLESESCQIFDVSEAFEDEMFNDGMNILIISCDITVVENIQIFCTSLFSKQSELILDLKFIKSVQKVCIKQLLLGEASLKGYTLELLAKFFKLFGPPEIELWIEESFYFVQLLELLTSGELTKKETQLIESGWIACAREMTLMSETQLKILSINLIPTWQASQGLHILSSELKEHLKKLLCCVVFLEDDTSQIREWILDNNESDINIPILGSLALKELSLTEAWIKRKDQNKISFSLESKSWNAILLQQEMIIGQFNALKRFCSLIEEVLFFIVKNESHIEIEILSKQCMGLITKNISNYLCQKDCNVSEGLDCLETIIKCGHLWPGASHLGSDLASLHHSWAASLSLPWLATQEQGKFLDLRIADNKDVIMAASGNVNWSTDEKSKALLLLAHLPKDVCPRWRLSVAKLAWSDKCPGVVACLPALVTNTGSSLGHDVVQHVVGRGEHLQLVRGLAKVSKDYVCSLARRNVSKLAVAKGECIKFTLLCQDCHGGVKDVRTPSKSSGVEVEPFLKMIGHQDKDVRLSLVSMLKSVSKHSVLSPAAAELWINYVSDGDEEVRREFAKNVQWIFR